MKKTILLICLCCCLSNLFAKLIFVNSKTEIGLNDGTSWQTAYLLLQPALKSAQKGDSIWVAQGIYSPDSVSRDSCFVLRNGVALFGGFSGNENHPSQRDWIINETILSGERGDTSNLNDNHIHVLKIVNADSTTILDGFIITKGYAEDTTKIYYNENVYGGGIYIESNLENFNTTPQIRNCKFIHNIAQWGGAIYCNSNISTNSLNNPSIDNCYFYRNYAQWIGGAIYKKYGSPNGLPFKVTNSTFIENVVRFRFGGAIYVFDPFGETLIDNCIFEKDSTIRGEGGAIFFELRENGGNIRIENSRFTKNRSETDGAAVEFHYTYLSIIDPIPIHHIKLYNCTFEDNFSFVGSGGALNINGFCNETFIEIDYCRFVNNYARNGGGGIYSEYNATNRVTHLKVNHSFFKNNTNVEGFDGNIYCRAVSSKNIFHEVFLSNSLFISNGTAFSAYTGQYGAFESTITNCTFYKNGVFHPLNKNWSPDFDYVTHYNTMKIVNSIFYENLPTMEEVFRNNSRDSFHLADYEFQNCWINTPPGESCETNCGEGMLYNQFPLFKDAENEDFTLSSCSPAVNGGNNIFLDNLVQDITGNTRIKDGVVDMGAYENNVATTITNHASLHNASAADKEDGEIVISNVAGGIPPYQYLWNTGDTLASIQNLAAGNYILTITDQDDCTKTFDYTISFTSDIKAIDKKHFFSIIYPNPSTDGAIWLQLNAFEKETLAVHIFDITGKLIKKEIIESLSGTTIHPLFIPTIKGLFLVKISNSRGEFQYHKLEIL